MAFAYENLIAEIPDYPGEGVIFQDITPVLADADGFKAIIDDLSSHFADRGITKVIGAEARGFIIGAGIAYVLGIGFITARKHGKLPRVGYSAAYNLEYGTDALELPVDCLTSEDRVLIVDDLLATGGTAAAIGRMVNETGATISGYGFFVELAGQEGRQRIAEITDAEVYTLCAR